MRKYRFLFVIVFVMFIMIPFEVSAMQIFVKKPNAEDIALEVKSSNTIEEVKEKIYVMGNTFLPENQKLVFAGNELVDGRTLSDYEIKRDDTIRLILSINNEKVKVIFDANGGSFEDGTTYVIDDWHAELYDGLVNPAKEGYKFKGCYTEKMVVLNLK